MWVAVQTVDELHQLPIRPQQGEHPVKQLRVARSDNPVQLPASEAWLKLEVKYLMQDVLERISQVLDREKVSYVELNHTLYKHEGTLLVSQVYTEIYMYMLLLSNSIVKKTHIHTEI